jgi:hypothetical protein
MPKRAADEITDIECRTIAWNATAHSRVEVHARHSAVEVSIEKYEKTAMQWLKEKTQNN